MYSSLVLRQVCLVSHFQHLVFDMSDMQGPVVGNPPSVLSCYQGKLMGNGGNLRIPLEVTGVIITVRPFISERRMGAKLVDTLTGVTQWTRPGGNAFVIPLGLIQQTALPPRPVSAATLEPRGETPAHLSPNKRNLAPPLSPEGPIRAGPRPPPSPRRPEANGSPSRSKGSKQLKTVDEVWTDDMSIQMSTRESAPRRVGSGTSMEELGELDYRLLCLGVHELIIRFVLIEIAYYPSYHSRRPELV